MQSIIDYSYPFKYIGRIADGTFIYHFESVGELLVKKRVRISVYSPNRPDIFNVALVNEELDKNGHIVESDTSIVNNHDDWNKVLNTVFLCAFDFILRHSYAYLLFIGNSYHKQIIYKRKVTANLKMLEKEFLVFGGFATFDLEYTDITGNIVLPTDTDFETKKNRLIKTPVNVVFKSYEQYSIENSKKYDFLLIRLKDF